MSVSTEGLGSVQSDSLNKNRPASSTYGGQPGSTGWVIEQITCYVADIVPHTVDVGYNGNRVHAVPLKEFYTQLGGITEFLIKLEGRCKDIRMAKAKKNPEAERVEETELIAKGEDHDRSKPEGQC